MLLKNLELKKTDECTRDELAIYIGDTRIGFVVNAIGEAKGVWKIDGVIVGCHKSQDLDYILAVEITDEGRSLLRQRTNTTTFTKRIGKLMGFKASEYSARFYRGFYEDRNGGVYDAADKLLYDNARYPTAGAMMDYPTPVSKRAITLINIFGDVEKPRRRSRRFR